MELESPQRYFYWAGLASLAAVVRRNVSLNRGGAYRLYPNVYVMLAGDSGLKKSLPISVAEKIVRATKSTKVFAGRSSVKGIIKHLATAKTNPDGSVDKESSGFIASSEFSMSIVADEFALTMMTDLYDGHYHDEFEYTLNQEYIPLKNLCITMLSASNEGNLQGVITQRETVGGFVARTFWIHETEPNCRNDLLDDLQFPFDYEKMAEYLNCLKNIKGEFVFSKDAKAVYRDWYASFDPAEMNDETGTANRFGDQVMKLVMLHSLAESPNLIISADHVETAIRDATECLGSLKRVRLGQFTGTPAGLQRKIVLEALLKAPGFTRSKRWILSRYWKEIGREDLDAIMSDFEAAGIVTFSHVSKDVMVKLKDSVVEEYNKARREIN